MLKGLIPVFIITLLQGCGGGSLETDSDTASFLDGKTAGKVGKGELGGLNMKFKKDGSISMKSPYPDDPTQYYTGKWVDNGGYEKGTDGFESRKITIYIYERGWKTDGIPPEAAPGLGANWGLGHVLKGVIINVHEFTKKPYITFEVPESQYKGMTTMKDGQEVAASDHWDADLE